MRVLVIGRGSAAKRHKRVLEAMGHEVSDKYKKQSYAVIATLTSNHADGLAFLKSKRFKGECLIEKPLFMTASEEIKVDFPVYVGYQLRFHPVMQTLKKLLDGAQVYSAHIYAGQHIDFWGGTYHADKSMGGGLLRDYSHEFDLIQWLFGLPAEGNATGISNVNISCLQMVCSNGAAVSMQLNYLDMEPKREWIINTSRGSITVDLLSSTINGVSVHFDPDEPTRKMHEAILSGGDACTFEEGLEINRLIDRIEA
jgi:predicted dehydrogenase